jgi:hypothetical protein
MDDARITEERRVSMIERGFVRNMEEAEAIISAYNGKEEQRAWREKCDREREALRKLPDTDPRFATR